MKKEKGWRFLSKFHERPGGETHPAWLRLHRFMTLLTLHYVRFMHAEGNVRLLKDLNTKLNEIEIALGYSKLYSVPTLLRIGVTRRCNLKCTICGVGHRTREEEAVYEAEGTMDLSMEDYRVLAREIFPYLSDVEFNQNGESFVLGDRFMDMLALADAYDVNMTVSTNGMLLNRKKLSSLLDLKNLKCLIFSLDGSSKEMVEGIRIGARLEKIVENIRLVASMRREKKKPILQVLFVAMKSNLHELPPLIDLAAEWGADRLSVSYLYVNPFSPLEESLYFSKEEANRIFRESARRAREKDVELWLPPLFGHKTSRDFRCDFPWNAPSIVPGGFVVPCCMLFGRDHRMGHVREGFRRIWNSKRYRKLRRSLVANTPSIRKCRYCNFHYNGFEPDKLSFHLTEEMMEAVQKREAHSPSTEDAGIVS